MEELLKDPRFQELDASVRTDFEDRWRALMAEADRLIVEGRAVIIDGDAMEAEYQRLYDIGCRVRSAEDADQDSTEFRAQLRREIHRANEMTAAWDTKYEAWSTASAANDKALSEFIASLQSTLSAGRGNWACKAKCQHVHHDNSHCDPTFLFGTASGPDEATACVEAKRVATQSASPGCRARHCTCDCAKR